MSLDSEIDPEVEAYSKVLAALKTLDKDAQRRILRMCAERFDVSVARSGSADVKKHQSDTSENIETASFTSISDLFGAATHKNGLDRVLLCSYWFQVCQSADNFTSQSINDALKNLGYPSTNITRDFDGLKERKPSLVVQVQKQGTAKQARKLFKLTLAGITAAEKLISSNEVSEAE